MTFKITIYKYTETLESLVVEFDSYEKAESYGSGIYDGLRLAGKEPTGQQVTKIWKENFINARSVGEKRL